ncbi:RTA1 like protein-domain-containing protein [Protomyces lactucae-debilis]|uniref:RTA1 like protein-domain-containing protein n=1 Tax=Protomyces lactucae-debilis TaxID=2754530 RepID=A0A1Y2FNM7_PROLT|nr:RTA1 like protein-domain-containing protein [Protomyces lactucae-debilis]ORY84325.1 RTA1 like protein-domain-containing protein [Protomyces lactucae-debilis]
MARQPYVRNRYIYQPSLPGAIASCIVSFALTVALSYQIRKYRTKYMIILAVGTAAESLGYVLRSLGASGRESSFPLYLLMQLFIVLAPLAFMAALYIIFGRLVRRVGQEKALIPPAWYARLFVTCDILSFLIQGAGAGFIVSDNRTTAMAGKNTLIGGLAFGLLSFASFCVMAILLHLRVLKDKKHDAHFRPTGMHENWQTIWIPLYIGMVAILVRTIFRLVEFSLGWFGKVNSTEWYLYVFDMVAMAFTAIAFIVYFPARFGLDQSLDGVRGDVEMAASPTGGSVTEKTSPAELVSRSPVL